MRYNRCYTIYDNALSAEIMDHIYLLLLQAEPVKEWEIPEAMF